MAQDYPVYRLSAHATIERLVPKLERDDVAARSATSVQLTAIEIDFTSQWMLKDPFQ